MQKVMEVLDKSEEGKINYRKLNEGIKDKKITNKIKAVQKKADEIKKRKAEQQLLNPESSRSNSVHPSTGANSLRSSMMDVSAASRR